MVKQISLDTWSVDRMYELLKKGTNIVTQTNLPIVLYRETLEENEGTYEELSCSLTHDHVVEQVVIYGGMVIASIIIVEFSVRFSANPPFFITYGI